MTELPREERFLAHLEENKRILYKVANAYGRSAEDRRDLAQEIAAQLWRSFPRFDERACFATWMYRVAMNVGISFSRSESRRASRTAPLNETILEIAAPERAPEESPDDLRRLHDFIRGELDDLNRALVILYLDGNSHETIGEILGISTSNVGTRMGRIKDRLRNYFDRVSRGRETERKSWSSSTN